MTQKWLGGGEQLINTSLIKAKIEPDKKVMQGSKAISSSNKQIGTQQATKKINGGKIRKYTVAFKINSEKLWSALKQKEREML